MWRTQHPLRISATGQQPSGEVTVAMSWDRGSPSACRDVRDASALKDAGTWRGNGDRPATDAELTAAQGSSVGGDERSTSHIRGSVVRPNWPPVSNRSASGASR